MVNSLQIMYRNHTYCRACGYANPRTPSGIKAEAGTERLQLAMDLGIQPLANDFRGPNEERSGYAPLQVMLCPKCSLGQLSVVVDPKIMYRNYAYVTSDSQMMKEHFAVLRSKLVEIKPTLGSVLEIGSNDGLFLSYLATTGGVNWVMGVDPAENLSSMAAKRGVPTVTEMWSKSVAESLRSTRPYDTIIARHVLAHVDDWKGFIQALEIVSHAESIVAIEVPYVADMFSARSFDQIYHEHLSYVSIKSIEHLLSGTKFYLHDVLNFSIHGGAIVLILKRSVTGNEIRYQHSENVTLADWQEFERASILASDKLTGFLIKQYDNGRDVCGYGASAKSTVWINFAGYKKKYLRFICDSTPQKQWKLSPGSDIPIVDEGALLRELPPYCIIFAWNFAQEIIRKNRLYLEKGGCFIVPLPQLSMVKLSSGVSEKLEIATIAEKV